MARKYNLWSFYLCLFCIILFFYSLYAEINDGWIIAPAAIILLLTLLSIVFGAIGFRYKKNWHTRTRSWFTVIASVLLAIPLLFHIYMYLLFSGIGHQEFIKSTQSPDNKFTIDFYHFDGGAAGTFGVKGELNGPLWFTKRIYYEQRVELNEVEWINNHTVKINKQTINLKRN